MLSKVKTENAGAFEATVRSFAPLISIPIVYGLVVPFLLSLFPQYGHDSVTAVLGAITAYIFVFHADTRARRLMAILIVFSFAFETANVASGFYHYVYPVPLYYLTSPLWIVLGWSVVGWYSVKAMPLFRKIPAWLAYGLVAASLLAVATAYNYWVPSLAFALFGVFLAALACQRIPVGMIAFTTIFGIVNEVVGSYFNIWSFTDKAGIAHIPEFGQLSIGYAFVLIFCLWLAGYDPIENDKTGGKV